MLSLLKSDIYKMFKKMSFYVCMFFVALSAGYSTWTQEKTIKDQYRMYASRMAMFGDPKEMYEQIDAMSGKDLGISAWSVLPNGLGAIITFSALFLTMFVSSEFSSGMCKALLIRGKSRIAVYISKLMSCILIPITYSLVALGINFGIGASRWQGWEWKDEYLNTYLIPIGWFLLVAITWQSLLCMTTFIFRGSGSSMAVNLGLVTLIPPAILLGLHYIATNWFNKNDIPFSDYWLGSYNTVYLFGKQGNGAFSSDVITSIVWTLSCWFIVPIVIGLVTFNRREIK